MIFARAKSHVEEGLNLYGRLNEKQREAVRSHVKGLRIHDLGAGDGSLALELIELGAEHVTTIERHDIHVRHPRVEVRQGYFHDFPMVKPDVAFASWPPNHKDYDLFRLCRDARILVYLGKNTDGTACGQPEMFEDMVHRELLAYVPNRLNTLIIVGQRLDTRREPRGEERAGLEMNTGRCLQYDHVEGQEAQTEAYLRAGGDVAGDRGRSQEGSQER